MLWIERTNAQRFDISELPIAVENVAFERRRTADVKDSYEVRLDGIDARK